MMKNDSKITLNWIGFIKENSWCSMKQQKKKDLSLLATKLIIKWC